MESHPALSSFEHMENSSCFVFLVLADVPTGTQLCLNHDEVTHAQRLALPHVLNNFVGPVSTVHRSQIRNLSVGPDLFGFGTLITHPTQDNCGICHVEDWILNPFLETLLRPRYLYRFRAGLEHLELGEVYIVSRNGRVYHVAAGRLVFAWPVGPLNVTPERTYTIPAPLGSVHPTTGQVVTHLVVKLLVSPFPSSPAPLNTSPVSFAF